MKNPIAAIGPEPIRRSALVVATGFVIVAVVFVVLAALPSLSRGLGLTDVRTVTRATPKHESANQISREAVDDRSRELFPSGDDDDTDGASELALVQVKSTLYATPGKQRLGAVNARTAVLIIGEKAGYYRVVVLGDEKQQTGWISKGSVRPR